MNLRVALQLHALLNALSDGTVRKHPGLMTYLVHGVKNGRGGGISGPAILRNAEPAAFSPYCSCIKSRLMKKGARNEI
jgi:hypothetical protein